MENDLNKLIQKFKRTLQGALLSCDLWEKDSLVSIATYNSNPKCAEFLGKLTLEIHDNLEKIGLPDFGKYQVIDLEMDSLLVIINLEQHLLGAIIDKSKVTYGVLLAMIIPDIVNEYQMFYKE